MFHQLVVSLVSDFCIFFFWNGAGAFKSTTTGTSRSNISSNSGFSAASGEDAYPEGQILPTPNLRIFSVAELRAATRNFKSENVLGEGGFGKVFKGWLEDKTPGKHSSTTGTVIAVKKLNSESFQGFEEWQVSSKSSAFSNESWRSRFLEYATRIWILSLVLFAV